MRLLQQVVCERHRLNPCEFVSLGPFRLAFKVEMGKQSQTGNVDSIRYAPYHLGSHVLEAVSMTSFIRQQHSEKDCPLAVPVARDLVIDMLDRGRQLLDNGAHGCVYLRLGCGCNWQKHSNSPSSA